jgi:hypothetical protein
MLGEKSRAKIGPGLAGGLLPTHDDRTVMDGAPEGVGGKQIPPLRCGMTNKRAGNGKGNGNGNGNGKGKGKGNAKAKYRGSSLRSE